MNNELSMLKENFLLKEQVKQLEQKIIELEKIILTYKVKIENDQLTGIYNRETFEGQVIKTINNEGNGVLIILDVDNFKSINDKYGHSRGDYVLIELAKVLSSQFRKTDYVGRFGGDEFLIFLKDIDTVLAKDLVEKLINVTSKIMIDENDNNFLSISVGMVKFNPNLSYSDNFKLADEALYISKNTNKGSISIQDNIRKRG